MMARLRGVMDALDQLRINICGGGINIHEYGTRAAIRNRFGRSQKRIRRSDHFVARLHSQRQQPYMERRRSAAQRDAVPRATEIGKLALEGLHFLALHERRILADAVERWQNLIAQIRVLGL